MEKFPLTVKRSIELLGLCLVGALIILGKAVIMPLIIAFFVSIVLLPVYRALRKRLPASVAILLAILLMMAAGIVVSWFFTSQISKLLADFPQIKETVWLHTRELSEFITQKTAYSTEKQLGILPPEKRGVSAIGGRSAKRGAGFRRIGTGAAGADAHLRISAAVL